MRARFVIAIALALLVASCGDGGVLTVTTVGVTTSSATAESSSSTEASSTTLAGESSTTTVLATTTSAVMSSTWERLPDGDVPFGPGKQGMAGVTAGGPGLVAVGWDISADAGDMAAWTSPDGLAWQQVVVGGAERQYAAAVTAGGPGLVAVGYDTAGGDEDAAVWTSPDGTTWTRVPHDEAVFGGPGSDEMFGVVTGGPGLVAVGWGQSDGDDAAVVWVSADGSTWTRLGDNSVFGGPGAQGMAGVVAGGPGLVAVGFDASGEWEAAVWTSPDGLTWTRVPPDETVFGGPNTQFMNAVTLGGPGLVAVGTDYAEVNGDGAVWTSPDGLIWTRVPHDAAVFGGPGNQEMLGVASGSPGLVAVGRDAAGPDGDAAVWASSDGSAWVRVSEAAVFGGPWHQEMLAVTAGGPGLVAVGLEFNPDGHAQTGAVWVNRPES